MPTTATRRPPIRRPELGAPLAPEPATWPRDAALLVALGLAAVGLAPITDQPGWTGPAGLVACWFAALARIATGRRAAQRADLSDRLVEAISPLLGSKQPDRRLARVTRWSRGWPGHPTRVQLRYAPGLDDSDPGWRAELVTMTNRRLLENYQITRHDRRRCRLLLVWSPIDEDSASTPATQARAERTVTELLGPTARVTEVEWSKDGTELVAIEVRHEAGAKLAAAGNRTRIERVVSTMLPGRWRAKWELIEDRVRFEVRPPLPRALPHPAPQVDDDNRFRLPIAVGEDGEIISWHLRGAAPHAIVVGKTGQGKTVVINGIVMEACYRGWRVWICDPKRVEFMGLRGWPNVQIVATSVEDQIAVIYHAWEEMEKRYALIESGHADEDDFEPLILVLDEYRDFVGAANEWYAGVKVRGMPAKNPVFEKVSSLARKGRTARIHVILGTQRPDAEFLGGEMRDNFATRISLGRLSPQGAMMMWEAAYIGVAVPRGIPGRGTAVAEDDRPVEVQAYWTPDPRRLRTEDHDNRAILNHLKPAQRTHPALQVEMPEEFLHPADDSEPMMWQAVRAAALVPSLEQPADPLEDLDQHDVAESPRTPAELLAMTTAATPAQPGPSAAGHDVARPRPHEDEADDVDDSLDDYGDLVDADARTLNAGDLILVDEDTNTWAVVEADPEPDLEDPDLLCIDWRADDDSAGTISVPEDSVISARRPIHLDDLEETA